MLYSTRPKHSGIGVMSSLPAVGFHPNILSDFRLIPYFKKGKGDNSSLKVSFVLFKITG